MPDDYKGEHTAPDADCAPMWDLRGTYPDDIYTSIGVSHYGSGRKDDSEAINIIQATKGRRDKQVRVFRAIPKDAGASINKGDWVAITRSYAKEHGEDHLNNNFKIISKVVSARDLFTDGNSIQEWGYDPQPYTPMAKRDPKWERGPGFKKLVESKYKIQADSTLTLWHGGNLEFSQENISHKGGRWEHGPGLYLTTHYDTARKYAKGSRKLYRVVIKKGANITDVDLPMAAVRDFIDTYFIKTRKKDVISRIEKHVKDDKVNADTFLNITFNEQAIKNTDTDKLRSFLVQQGVDYSIVDNAFGWHERMVVLFNMKNIISKQIVTPKEKIETFDLPTAFTS